MCWSEILLVYKNLYSSKSFVLEAGVYFMKPGSKRLTTFQVSQTVARVMVQLQNVSADTNPGVICPKSGLKIQNFNKNLRSKKESDSIRFIIFKFWRQRFHSGIIFEAFSKISPCDFERCKNDFLTSTSKSYLM